MMYKIRSAPQLGETQTLTSNNTKPTPQEIWPTRSPTPFAPTHILTTRKVPVTQNY